MHARVVSVQGSAESLEAALPLWEETVAAALRQQPGFLGAVMLVDREKGGGRSVSRWESEEALTRAEAALTETRARASAAMAERGIQVVDIERYEVVAFERAQPMAAGTCVRTITGQGRPDAIEALRTTVRDRALPVMKAQPGFRSMIAAINRENGRLFLGSSWDSPADREASEAAMAPERAELQETLGATALQVHRLDVIYAETAAEVGAPG